MKKIVFTMLFVFLVSCASFDKQFTKIEPSGNNRQGWISYSEGLYYKNLKEYKKAMKHFLDAESFGIELDRVYHQLADCNFQLYNYENAVKYARMSIKQNPDYVNPYLIIFNVYSNLKNYNEAAAILEELITHKPDLVNIHFTLGNLYYSNLKDRDKAATYFNNILKITESKPIPEYYLEYSYYYLGYIEISKQHFKRAINYFKKCLEINPDNTSVIFMLAISNMSIYDLEQAEKYSLQYYKLYPYNVRINTILGRIYYLNDSFKAITHLKRASRSRSGSGFLAKALYLELLKKDLESEKILRQFMRINKTYISPHLALAKISQRNGKNANALSEYFATGILMYSIKLYYESEKNLLKALAFNDKIPEIYFYLARLYEDTDRVSLAIVNYKKAHELKPSADLLIHIGYLNTLRNDYKSAIQYFNLAIDKEPNNSKPYFFKGLMYSKKDKFPDAEKFFKKAIELNDKNDEYHFYLATVLEKQNKLEATYESLKKAIYHNPKNSRAYNYLGYLYADKNIKIDESIKLIKKALEIEPLNGAYLDSLGWAYFRKRKYDLALENLLLAEEQMQKINDVDPVVFDHIGDTYKEIGNIKKALEYWEKAIKQKKDKKIETKINLHKTSKK